MTRTRARGFTLLEVLVALLIFSIGLLGMAGLLMVSVRTNHGAYLRSQAGFLAQSMSERMRANMPALWAGSYNNAGYPIVGTPNTCASGCTGTEVATRDQIVWSNAMRQLLPAPTATIACALNAGAAVPGAVAIADRAPYDGLCTITMRWSETSLEQGDGATFQTFAWVFQP